LKYIDRANKYQTIESSTALGRAQAVWAVLSSVFTLLIFAFFKPEPLKSGQI
jgi:hypothetical protein